MLHMLGISIYEFAGVIMLLCIPAFIICAMVPSLTQRSLKAGGVLAVFSLALFANHPFTYSVAIFILATTLTELEFLQNLAAIFRGGDYFAYQTSRMTQAEIIAKRIEDEELIIDTDTDDDAGTGEDTDEETDEGTDEETDAESDPEPSDQGPLLPGFPEGAGTPDLPDTPEPVRRGDAGARSTRQPDADARGAPARATRTTQVGRRTLGKRMAMDEAYQERISLEKRALEHIRRQHPGGRIEQYVKVTDTSEVLYVDMVVHYGEHDASIFEVTVIQDEATMLERIEHKAQKLDALVTAYARVTGKKTRGTLYAVLAQGVQPPPGIDLAIFGVTLATQLFVGVKILTQAELA